MSRRHSNTHKPQNSDTQKASLSHQLLSRGGVKDHKVMAAVVGKDKYGDQRMANWSDKADKS